MNSVQLNQLNAVKSIIKLNQASNINNTNTNNTYNPKSSNNTLQSMNSIPNENILQSFLKMQCRNNILSNNLTNLSKQPDTLSEDSNDIHVPKMKTTRGDSHDDAQLSDNSMNKKAKDLKDNTDTSSEGSKKALSINSHESSHKNYSSKGPGGKNIKRKRNKFTRKRSRDRFRNDKYGNNYKYD